jgi:hypothetical protein
MIHTTRITNPRLQSGDKEIQLLQFFPLLTKEGLGEVAAIGLKPGIFLYA